MNNPRKDFYAREIDTDRVKEGIIYLVGNLTLSEILKVVREISNDMVCYHGPDNKGIVYNDSKSYSKLHVEQATTLQRTLRTYCDLFNQSIIGKREFADNEFNNYNINYLRPRNSYLEDEVDRLEGIINNLKDAINNG